MDSALQEQQGKAQHSRVKGLRGIRKRKRKRNPQVAVWRKRLRTGEERTEKKELRRKRRIRNAANEKAGFG